VEVGDHAANVEILLDREAGRLTLWALDGHAENPVRLPDSAIAATIVAGGVSAEILLQPVARPLTGETVGDTSEFSAVHERLKGAAGDVIVRIPRLVVRGVEALALETTLHGH
jgi:hypothetical protein